MSTSKNGLVCSVLATLILLTAVCCGAVSASAPYLSYTYDYFGHRVPSPQAYLPSKVIRGSALGVGDFRNPSDLFVTRDNRLYVLDTGNDRIVCIDQDSGSAQVIKELYNEGKVEHLNRPRGMFVADDGSIYVADTENSRVVHIDEEGNVIREISKPESPEEGIIPSDFVFKPVNVVVSGLGRIYVLAANVYDGIMEFDFEGVFRGFIGAPRVAPSAADILWSRLATREQRARQALFLPANYRTIDIDSKGFIYATERNTIKRLNPAGVNVLVEHGFFPPQGDLVAYDETESDFVDILSRVGGMYSVLDRTRGRVFTYDQTGNLLYVFGGLGNTVGLFAGPAAIEQWNGNMVVLDQQINEITVFEPTEYANLIHSAIYYYNTGQTDLSVQMWKRVLERNANYDLGYSGIGRALLLADEYEPAMASFKNGNDRDGYSEAYSNLRRELIAQNLGKVLSTLVLAFILVWLLVKGPGRRVFIAIWESVANTAIRSVEHALARAPRQVTDALKGLRYSIFVMLHPADGFFGLKHEGKGNVLVATGLLTLETLAYVFIRQYSGFLFNPVDLSKFSVLAEASSILVPFLLWCGVNWCLTTLLDGKGSLRDIYVATSYALVPLVVVLIPAAILSNYLVLAEGFLYYLLLTLGMSWAGVLLLAGTLITHEYTFEKTILTSILTMVGIGIVIFIGMLFFAVISQVTTFVSDIYTEVAFRL